MIVSKSPNRSHKGLADRKQDNPYNSQQAHPRVPAEGKRPEELLGSISRYGGSLAQ